MSDPLLPCEDGTTELSHEEREGLILSYVTLRSELNAAEQQNILQAESWAFKRKNKVADADFLNDLHKRMFGRVWKWAGKYRLSGKNIGVDAHKIPIELKKLCDDCKYWIENQTYEPDEIAGRFHHRLIFVHPYPNGNGRHARLAADLLLRLVDRPRFTWGRELGLSKKETRDQYVESLRAADGHDHKKLFKFVRS